MNSDTVREVKEILEQGWYRKGTTLGEGGWEYLFPKINEWKTYILSFMEDSDQITAKDDETAIKAFSKLYNLDGSGWYRILERVVDYREVSASKDN